MKVRRDQFNGNSIQQPHFIRITTRPACKLIAIAGREGHPGPVWLGPIDLPAVASKRIDRILPVNYCKRPGALLMTT
jgi:hypothetical protein